MQKNTITILGAGSFGTALAQLLAGNGHTVHLWDHNEAHIQALLADHENKKYLPGIKLHANIKPISDISNALSHAQWIFEAIPVAHLRSVLERARPYVQSDQVWVVLSKGIEAQTNYFPTQIIDAVFGCDVKKVVISGPSFAHELALQEITGLTIATADNKIGIQIQNMFQNDFLSTSLTNDVIGVQVGAAFKNVISIGIGMLEGAGFGENTKALLLTLGLHEAADFAVALGGKRETLYGLSGVGDLVLSSLGGSGRNWRFGVLIGNGASVEDALRDIGYTVEGLNTIKSVAALAKKYNVHAPVSEGIESVVNGEKTLEQMMKNIMGANSRAHESNSM